MTLKKTINRLSRNLGQFTENEDEKVLDGLKHLTDYFGKVVVRTILYIMH